MFAFLRLDPIRMSTTEKDVLDALSELVDPVTGRNFVESRSVKNVKVEGERVSLDVALGYPARGVLEKVRSQVAERLKRLPGVAQASVNVHSKIVPHSVQRGVKLHAGIKNIIAVASGKGGVGKSTTAVNLALGLQALGLKVGILDADIYGPSMPRLLGLTGRPEAISGRILKPLQRYGLNVMSMGFLVEEETPMIWRGPMVISALTQMLREVAWGELDTLVVDMPPGTGDVALSLSQSVPVAGAVLVTTPQGVSLADTRRAVRMYEKLNVPPLGLIENMSHFICRGCGAESDIFGKGGGEALAKDMNVPFLGAIPIYEPIRVGGDTGVPICVGEPKSPAAQSFRVAAHKLAVHLANLSFKQQSKAIPLTQVR